MIDSHAHLAHTDYDPDIADTIRRAQQAGVRAIVNVGYDLETSVRAIEQAEQFAGVYATVGVHPHEASKWNSSTHDRLLSLASHPKVVAVGETGLDFHYDFSPCSCQEETFRSLLHLSVETGLPLVIHNREADEVTLRILEEERKGEVAGVFHCFTSDGDYARRVLDRGLHLGFTGVITYKRSEPLRSVVKETPSNRLLIETDCPYLAPQSKRGQRNEPAYVVEVAEKVAEVKGIGVTVVEQITTENASRLFNIASTFESQP